MTGIGEETGERMVNVTLIGGPDDLPADRRTVLIDTANAPDKIKIEYYGGYQHFEPADEPGGAGRGPRIFRWTGFTKIAE
ncbi:DUF5988 family protein [Streptomyces sp. NPDC086080]|uniref:DUF5988 family protein n=1 Tax=Streptomyces sp. NPDC086080 TaxID=3365748 RepID=UPI0037CCC657